MENLIFNTKTLKRDCQFEEFYSFHEVAFKTALTLLGKKVKLYGDFDFFEGEYFCNYSLRDFVIKIATGNGGYTREEKSAILSVLDRTIEDDQVLSKICTDELTSNDTVIDEFSADALSFKNRMHQLIFTQAEGDPIVNIKNKNTNEKFELYLVHDDWSYKVFKEINLLDDKCNITRIFEESNETISSKASFVDFTTLDIDTKKEILVHIFNQWPQLIKDGGKSLGTRFVQPVTGVLRNKTCYEYRLKCNEKQYRIYFTIKDGVTYILADYYKKTGSIPQEIKNRIIQAYNKMI